MKINLDEICRGYSETLEKQAVGAYLPSAPEALKLAPAIFNKTTQQTPYTQEALDALRTVTWNGDPNVYHIPKGVISDERLPGLKQLFVDRDNLRPENTPFSDYINKNMYGIYANQGPLGHIAAPFLHGWNALGNAAAWGTANLAKNYTPGLLKQYRKAENIGGGMWDLAAGAYNSIDADPVTGGGALPNKPGLSDLFARFAHDFRYDKDKLPDSLGAIKDHVLDGAKSYLTLQEKPSDYIVPGLAIAGTGALIHQMYKSQADKKAKAKAKAEAALAAQQAAQQAVKAQAQQQQQLAARSTPQTHIYNIMPRTPMGFGADAYTKYGSEKTADMVDALASSVGRRVADKVLTQAIGAPSAPKEEHKEKEIEITSKYPEMEKMLKKKKNKEYLEKLLKD